MQQIAKQPTPTHRSTLEELFVHSWWAVFFILACYAVYEQGMMATHKQISELEERADLFRERKNQLLVDQSDLNVQINSQSDRMWIQLVLIKVLGLVPEDQKKVYFRGAEE